MSRLIIENASYVVTVDATDTVLRDTTITIDDGVITSVTPATQVGHEPGEAHTTTIDARGKLVMPGLVNLHTHLPMTLLRGLAEDVDLDGFLARVWAAEGAVMDTDTVELGEKYRLLTGRDLPAKGDLDSTLRQLRRWGIAQRHAESTSDNYAIAVRPAIVDILGETAIARLTRWSEATATTADVEAEPDSDPADEHLEKDDEA